MLVEQVHDETVASFKRSANVETHTKQRRMQNDIAEYDKSLIRTYSQKNLSLILHHDKWEEWPTKAHEIQLEKHLSKHLANLLKNMIWSII